MALVPVSSRGVTLDTPAGGDLAGFYPSPTLAADAVSTADILDNAVTAAKLATDAVTTGKIGGGQVTPPKLGGQAATPASCRVYRTASQSINSGTPTALQFDNEAWDTDTMHDNVTNNTRITCVTAGKYIVGGSYELGAVSAAKECYIYPQLNGNTVQRVAIGYATSPVTATTIQLAVAVLVDLAVADYLELFVSHNQGSALSVLADASGAATARRPSFWALRVGA